MSGAPRVSVSLDDGCGIKELRALYEHLQARILEMIETLDDLRASAETEVFRAVEENLPDRSPLPRNDFLQSL